MSLLHVSCKLFFTFLTNTLKRLERQCTDSGECHFPFVYKGRTYKSCIESKIGLADWCSLTAEYDDEWDRCDKSCPLSLSFVLLSCVLFCCCSCSDYCGFDQVSLCGW
ncbi:unnamed protein product [Clavelina lepadiformis]|uniref:Fibronectin type-II domain-containing protein n=1 Tax=Clavelina lepadiformis TaxID=159417 RepID=A0ABP0F8B1_CLALP